MSTIVKTIVTERIIRIIEEHDALPWEQENFELDRSNYERKEPYSMLNQLMLYGQPDRFYLTKNQIIKLDLSWKKGSNTHMVTFWRMWEKETGEKDENGDPVIEQIPVLRYYSIIGISDINGIDIGNTDFEGGHTTPIDVYLNQTGARITHNVNAVTAYYCSDTDTIITPVMEDCKNETQYYMGLCRELIRWTSHENRLNRKVKEKDAEAYGMEHLVCELGSAMLRKAFAIPWEKSSAVAVQMWVSRMNDDPSLIVTAASRAEKAVKYLTSLTEERGGVNIMHKLRGL